jgi:hypothetical protein
MKSKSDKPKTTDKNEERFYRFATALMAVPKKELDKQIAKENRRREKRKS